MTHRRFELHRHTDITGVSGTGVVAEGIAFSDGTVGLRWKSDWPTSVVFHDRGIEAVQAIHGHGGATRIVWLDFDGPPPADWVSAWTELNGYVTAAAGNPGPNDAREIRKFMAELKRRALKPVADWIALKSTPAAGEGDN